MLRKHVELHLKMQRAHFRLIYNWCIYHFKIWSGTDFQICQIWLTTQLTTCSVYIYTGSNRLNRRFTFKMAAKYLLPQQREKNPLIPFISYMYKDNQHIINNWLCILLLPSHYHLIFASCRGYTIKQLTLDDTLHR